MRFLRFGIIVGAFLLAPLATWAASDIGKGPVIEAIDGDRIVIIITPGASNRVGERGTEIRFGDRIKTGPRATVRVRYPDGSRLLVGRSTEMEIQENRGGSQYNQLYAGEVRGLIRKVKEPRASPKFIIRSRAAVMGVRGTDFVMNLDDAAPKADFHTLEGVVEVAGDEPTLMNGKGTLVSENQTVVAVSGAVSPVQTFSRKDFEKRMGSEAPAFVALAADVKEQEAREEAKQKQAALSETEQDVVASEKKERLRSFLELTKVRVSAAYLRQQTDASLFTGHFAWAPALNFTDWLAIRGNLAFFPMKGRTQDDRFLARQTGLGLELMLGSLGFEAMIGGEDWGKHADGGPYVGALVSFAQGGGLLNRFFVAFSAFDKAPRYDGRQQDNYTGMLRLGVEAKF